MATTLKFYRCKHITGGRLSEWTIGDYFAEGSCGPLGEFSLSLMDPLGVDLKAFTDGRDALREFLDTGAFDGMVRTESIADVEDQLVLAGIYAYDPHNRERQEEG